MQYEELIDKYRRGTLTEAELEILREWINNADADEIIRALEIKATADVTEPDGESIERLRSMVYSRIRQEQPDSEPEFGSSHGMGFWKKYAIAATMLLPLLLVGMYMWLGRDAEPQYMTVTTSGNNRTRVLLPDGSVAVVKGESSLEFPLTFSGNERRTQRTSEFQYCQRPRASILCGIALYRRTCFGYPVQYACTSQPRLFRGLSRQWQGRSHVAANERYSGSDTWPDRDGR